MWEGYVTINTGLRSKGVSGRSKRRKGEWIEIKWQGSVTKQLLVDEIVVDRDATSISTKLHKPTMREGWHDWLAYIKRRKEHGDVTLEQQALVNRIWAGVNSEHGDVLLPHALCVTEEDGDCLQLIWDDGQNYLEFSVYKNSSIDIFYKNFITNEKMFMTSESLDEGYIIELILSRFLKERPITHDVSVVSESGVCEGDHFANDKVYFSGLN